MTKKLKIKPKAILYDEEGNKKGVILKFEAFDDLIENLSDLKSIETYYKRTLKPGKMIPLEEVMQRILGDDLQKHS